LQGFDPYPFSLLSVVLSMEAVLLTSFVLIRQNRMSKRVDQRSHLDLQINLLSEKEVTKVLQVLQRISRHLGIEEWNRRIFSEITERPDVCAPNSDERALPSLSFRLICWTDSSSFTWTETTAGLTLSTKSAKPVGARAASVACGVCLPDTARVLIITLSPLGLFGCATRL
jgi:hypothetical protein